MYFATTRSLEIPDSFEAEIARRISRGDSQSFIYIVPTGAQARDLINRLTAIESGRAILLPRILSLSELISKLRSTAKPQLQLLSDAQSVALIELSIRELFENASFRYFEPRTLGVGSLPLFRGTFDEIVASINGLKEQGITNERLRELLDSQKDAQSSSYRKLSDIIAIYEAYERKLGASSIDQYGQYATLIEGLNLAATENNVQAFQRIFVAAFEGVNDVFVAPFVRFSEPALKLLTSIALFDTISTTFALDYEPGNPGLFRFQEELLQKLQASGFVIHSSPNSQIGELQPILGTQLFNRQRRKQQPVVSDLIEYSEAQTIERELRIAARKIKRLITKDKVELSKICIASSDQEVYALLAQSVFREYGIPVQLTHRRSLASSPLFQAIDSLLELGEFRLSHKRVRSILESPYFLLTHPNGDLIDSNNLLRVLRKHHFRQGAYRWLPEIDGYIADIEEQLASRFDDPMLERDLRKDLEDLQRAGHDIVVIESLTEELSTPHTPAEFTDILKRIFAELETLRVMLSQSSNLVIENLELETRSYKMFIELLDELLTITETLGLSKKKLAAGFYLERLRIAATRARFTIRAEPQSAVVITSFDQIIGNEFDHLFLVGLREGLFPLAYKRSLFTPDEYSKTHSDHLIEQRYLFYQTVCTARKKIYLSWHTGSQDGTKKYSRSSVVSSLEEILAIPKSIDNEQLLLSPGEFYKASAQSLDWNSASDLTIAIDSARTAGLNELSLARLTDIQPSVIKMERTRRTRPGTIYAGILPTNELSDAELERLGAYRESVYSVSQLETYAACGFKFFSRYLLGISSDEREIEEGLDASEQGTMLHETLYKLLERCSERGLNIREMGPNAVAIANELIGELYPKKNNTKLHPFARLDRERLFEARSAAGSLLERFIAAEQTEEMRRILAQPRFFELVFGHKNIPQREGYPDNSKPVEIGGIKLRGKIDRVDMDEQGRFLIVDYKSGSSASMKDITSGYSLQLPLYLRIAEDLFRAHLGSDVQGVAALYHSLKYTEEKREFRIVLSEAMKEGVFEKTGVRTKFESPEALADFIEMVVGYAKSYVEGIAEGRFALVKEERRPISCRVCEYSSVCRVAQAEADGVLLA